MSSNKMAQTLDTVEKRLTYIRKSQKAYNALQEFGEEVSAQEGRKTETDKTLKNTPLDKLFEGAWQEVREVEGNE